MHTRESSSIRARAGTLQNPTGQATWFRGGASDSRVLQEPGESTAPRPLSKRNSQSTLAATGPVRGNPNIQWHILGWLKAYRPVVSTATLGTLGPPHFFQVSLPPPVLRPREGLLVFADGQPCPASAPEKWTEITQASELDPGPQRTRFMQTFTWA